MRGVSLQCPRANHAKTSKETGTESNRLNHRSTLFQNWHRQMLRIVDECKPLFRADRYPLSALPAMENHYAHHQDRYIRPAHIVADLECLLQLVLGTSRNNHCLL
jgi:hypothetical protein